MEYNGKNMEKLARQVVEDWDMNTLMSYATEQVEENYKKNKCDFEGDLEFYPEMCK